MYPELRHIADTAHQKAVPFGQYLLLKRLAVGGMAELYLAKEKRGDRLVVIKRILPYLAQEPEFVQMFLDEARIAAQLHHPNIITVYELGSLEGSIFIAMEFVEGVDLRKILQKEQARQSVVPPNIAAWLTARLCDGLHYAHNKVGADGRPLGIIHRDVSPQNLMVGYGGQVKLVDFGIAKAGAFMERSKPGVIKGKFLYLSPEQLSQDRIDHRADLFALGTMLYEICVGKSPFYKPTTEAVIYSIRSEDPPPPHIARGRFPERLSRIIMRCLIKDRSRRFQQAGEVHAELEAWLKAEAPTTAEDVKRYVATLFGDDEERTMLFIPPNARGPNDRVTGATASPPPAASTSAVSTAPRAPVEATDPDRTARGVPSPLEPDETTKPLRPPRPLEEQVETTASNSSPVGRRPTPAPNTLRATVPLPATVRSAPALSAEPSTQTSRPEDLERELKAGREPGESTVPLVQTPLARPALRRAASNGLQAAGSPEGELEATSLSQSGAGALLTGESLSALTPSPVMVPRSEPVRAETPARRSPGRRESAAVFEVPERFARDEIPSRPPPVATRPSQNSAPKPPRRATPGRVGSLTPSVDDLGPLLDSAIPSQQYRKNDTYDQDDDEATLDLRGAGTFEGSMPGSALSRRPWLVMLLVFAAVLTVGLVTVSVMRARRREPAPPPPAVNVEAPPEAPSAPAVPEGAEPVAGSDTTAPAAPTQIDTVQTVLVKFRAPPGTRLVRDGVSLTPNSAYRWSPGPYRVQFRCPKKGRTIHPDITLTVEVTGKDPEQTVELCR